MKNQLLFLFLFLGTSTFAQKMSYYLPDSLQYDPKIPTPEQFLGHEVGKWHVSHDKLLFYMRELAQKSDRIRLDEHAKTYEDRPIILLTISSPKNLAKIDQIQAEHLQLTDPKNSDKLDISQMPTVLWQGYSIHGNEPSGSNAALLAAYYLAAAQGEKIEKILENVVILFDPSFNPDGLNRFASWVNSHKSQHLVTDPNSREFEEIWPRGRTNHYWFDLNRDWLPVQMPESKGRIQKFHAWKPNILTDHHEMGTNSTFFFQPGVPSRVNPLTPKENQELTQKIGTFHAQFFDRIGSLYYTQEDYDDFFYGKGSTFPDINGGIGILFEQASSRGHAQESQNGVLSFPFTIRNQFTASLSTIEAAYQLRPQLLAYQKDFYKKSSQDAQKDAVKAYVFGEKNDQTKVFRFLEILHRHQIEVYELDKDMSLNGQNFEKNKAFVVPTNQKEYKIIKTLFQQENQFTDSLFYDISAWTMPMAFNIPFAELKGSVNLGKKLEKPLFPKGQMFGQKTNYAYLLEWNEFYAPKVLKKILDKGFLAKVAHEDFALNKQKFGRGTILIAVEQQKWNADQIFEFLSQLALENGVKIHAVPTGISEEGIDLGSNNFDKIRKPEVLLVVGSGAVSSDAGEIWHLLDQHLEMPPVLVEADKLNSLNLERYNHIVMADGNYQTIGASGKENIKNWVKNGNTLTLFQGAIQWANSNGISQFSFKNKAKADSTLIYPYSQRHFVRGSQEINGVIALAKLDLSHPLAYGYEREFLPVFKQNALFLNKNHNPYASPLIFTEKPLLSGYLSKKNQGFLPKSAVISVNSLGKGKVIGISENMVFRAFWYGTNRIFINSLFFGNLID